ncbi:DUF1775 domain-containing protein (plasmid) [Sorangium sp. So ce119]|uniref:DUF1775 domain-containing protein n=1 Tax=Sorangium sp. So ce119 TaxID=3133279 RepID=UPI003F5F1C17
MKRALQSCLIVAGSLFTAMVAHAHVSVSGPAFAGATHEASFGVGHGCDGADTYRVKVQIPAGVTSVRPMDSTFGKAALEKDAEGNVTAVVWTKPLADVLPADTSYSGGARVNSMVDSGSSMPVSGSISVTRLTIYAVSLPGGEQGKSSTLVEG